jgi:pimeloyl-ACP methyl ester carboxylesterase
MAERRAEGRQVLDGPLCPRRRGGARRGGTDKIVLVGHSMGAPVIRQYARLYPQHVAALVAVDGPLDMRQFPTTFTPPPLTGPEGLKAREGMIRGMFTPQTSPRCRRRCWR